MANISMTKQIDLTLKLLVILLAEPRVDASILARMVGMSENWVNKMMSSFREAGVNIEYDRPNKRYSVGLSDEITEGILGKIAAKLRREIGQAKFSQPPVRFVSSLDRYTVREFSQYLGTTPQNIYNMISGYKGAELPSGWCAFQLSEGGKWFIQRMPTDKTGKVFRLPDNVKEGAHSVIVGKGNPVKGTRELVERSVCAVPKCGEPILAKRLCNGHYYQARRHPEEFKNL